MRLVKFTALFTLLCFSAHFAIADVAEGEKLFNANCTACHSFSDRLVGPALKDVEKRRSDAWLLKWIKNAPEMVKSGDADAVKLFNEFNQVPMTPFTHLSDDQIKSIIAFMKTGGPAPAPVAAASGEAAPAGTSANTTSGDPFYNNTTLYALALMALILFLIVFVLLRIKKTVREIYYQRFPEKLLAEAEFAVDPRTTWKYKLFKKHPVVGVMVVGLVFTLVLGIYGFDYGNRSVGVQKGYAPVQPINYSHELHAGKYKINCLYCHSGADKGKQATIPSPSTCMNCHMHVTASKNYDGKISPEIQKIYDAVGWDGDKKMYDPTKPKQPIKWVRVHNLPDLAYFNHGQHVKIGKVECQACHGPIETMKVVSQHASLQMGWCINCHREAKVDLANNDFYEKLHAQLKSEGKSYATVANIGGLECGKCHY